MHEQQQKSHFHNWWIKLIEDKKVKDKLKIKHFIIDS